jgi:hypothetical protein
MNRSIRDHLGSEKGAVIFAVAVLVVLAMLSSSRAAWAEPQPPSLRATVPTPTPRRSPTALPTATTAPVEPTATTQPVLPTETTAPPPPTATTALPPPATATSGTQPPPTSITGQTPAPATATQAPLPTAPPVAPSETKPAVTATPCLACAGLPDDVAGVFANAGGDRITDSTGQVWLGDQPYATGVASWGYTVGDSETGTYAGVRPIKGTTDSPLYQTERWGMSGYQFSLPNGSYQVTLKFVEQFASAKGQRIFNVTLQAVTVLQDFDILAAAGGPLIALDRTFTATVTSNLLTIGFVKQVDLPTIAAIAVRPVVGAAVVASPGSAATLTAVASAGATQQTAPALPSVTSTPTGVRSPTTTQAPMIPPPPTSTAPAGARIVALAPESATALRSPDGSVHVLVPPGAVSSAMSLVYIPEATAPPAASDMRPGGAVFTLQPVDTAGLPLAQLQWQQPVTLVVGYTKDDLQSAGNQPSRLALTRYDSVAQRWVVLDAVLDRSAATLTGRISSPGLYALMVRQEAPAGPSPALVLIAGLAVVAIVGVIVLAVRARRSPGA